MKIQDKISANTTIFIVVLKYIVPIDKIDSFRKEHLEFLDQHYNKKIFHASGRQITLKGGVIIAKALSKKALKTILVQDPFYIHKLAKYKIYEFLPNKYSEEFKLMIN